MLQQQLRYWLLNFYILILVPRSFCNHTNDNLEASELKCFQNVKTDELWKACGATYDPGYNDLPVWGALVNITAYCMPYTNGLVDQKKTAYGTFWDINAQSFFASFLERFNNATGLRVGFQSRTVQEYVSDRMPAWPSVENPGDVDFWMVGAEVFGEGIAHKAFVDLTFLLDREDHYNFSDIPPMWRSASSSAFAGSYTALPFMAMTWSLLYRRDIFAAKGIAVPHTWEDVLAVADYYGMGRLGAGQPDLGFCFQSNVDCRQSHTAVGFILASMVQSKGPSEGSWFDPDDLQQLFLSVAMREALRIFVRLQAHSVDNRTACQEVYSMMASGRCLMYWGPSFAFKRGSAPSGPLRGRQGVAQVPGSSQVLDRTTGRLVGCTSERCPYATSSNTATTTTFYTTSTTSSNTIPPAAASATAGAQIATVTSSPSISTNSSTGTLVNRVYPLECISFTINAFAPLTRQAAAFALVHTFTTPSERLQIMLSPTSELGPLRFSELEESLWIDAGYEPSDIRSFLDATREFLTQPNVYVNLRIPGVFEIFALVQDMTQRAINSTYPYDEIMSDADTAIQGIIERAGGKPYLLSVYRSSIDFRPPPPPPPPPLPTSTPRQQKQQQIVFLVSMLVPIMAGLLLGAMVLWGYARYRRLRAQARAARSAAPGAGPSTTLLVTDIQDSTVLWEGLPADVMDAAVKLHHRVIREQLLKHKGYESATEGDSFILAFGKPDRALSFSLAAQEALLRADWPTVLTDSDSTPTLFVTCDAATCAAVLPYLAPSRLRTALASSLHGALAAGGGGGGPSSHNRQSLGLQPSACGSQYDMMSRRWPRTSNVTRTLFYAARPTSGSHHTFRGPVSGGASESSAAATAATTTTGTCTAATQSLGQGPTDRIGRRSFDTVVRHYSSKTLQQLSGFALRHMDSGVGSGPAAARSHALQTHSRTDTGMGLASGPKVSAERTPSVGLTRTPELMYDNEEEETVEAMAPLTMEVAATTLLDVSEVNSLYGDEPASSRLSHSISGNTTGRVIAAAATTFANMRSFLTQAFPTAARDSDGANQVSIYGGGASSEAGAGRGGGGGSGGVILLFRGLRVRMGLHCGISSQEMQYNRASSRMTYPGYSLQFTKAVSDAGRGGQILMSAAVRVALLGKASGVNGSGGPYAGGGGGPGGGVDAPYIVLNAGQHVLKQGGPAVELYCVFSPDLLPRAAYIAGLRSLQEKVPGVLSAPLGRVAVSVAHVQDVEDSAGWGLEACLDSHHAMSKEAAKLVQGHGGYLLSTPPGTFQAVFSSTCAAVHWLLELQEELGPAPGVPSAPDLNNMVLASSVHSDSGTYSDVACTLLRRAAAVAQLSTFHLKGGVDVGMLTSTLKLSGEMSYSGVAFKRAACLAASAAWHEVLVTSEAVRDVSGEDPAAAVSTNPRKVVPLRSKRRRVSVLRPSSATNLPPCPDQATLSSSNRPSSPQTPSMLAAELRQDFGLDAAAGSRGVAGPASGSGNAPLIANTPEGPMGLENPRMPSSTQLGAVRIGSDAVAPTIGGALVFGATIRLVKFKGTIIEVCTAVLAGGRGIVNTVTTVNGGGGGDGGDGVVADGVAN
ncbi:hypothetical protein VaNZ11_004969 [Volvox africanus]|uniref:Guanylate cyclase domain-containing protein n=1 Tax=Volvox africanus TaxID=51714 RepID=A0ABQ5RXP0_9CHLO|nr:hypothetical protein VaNZ11_004969 [Volvox africanus]